MKRKTSLRLSQGHCQILRQGQSKKLMKEKIKIAIIGLGYVLRWRIIARSTRFSSSRTLPGQS